MAGEDESPFAFSFCQSSQRQSVESTGVFDLAIHWFYAATAFLIDSFPVLRQEFSFHPFPQPQFLRDSASWRRSFFHGFALFPVFLCRDIQIYFVPEWFDLILVIVSCVRYCTLWKPSGVLSYLLHHRLELLFVVLIRNKISGDNNLAACIHCDLPVVSLDVSGMDAFQKAMQMLTEFGIPVDSMSLD